MHFNELYDVKLNISIERTTLEVFKLVGELFKFKLRVKITIFI